MAGRLEVITGPMFAGKTEELIRRIKRHELAGRKILLIKPIIDNRYSANQVVSHSGSHMNALVVGTEKSDLNVFLERAKIYDVIGIDEVQFWNKMYLVETVMRLVHLDKTVIVAGLDMNYSGELFGKTYYLMALADTVDKLTAVCKVCGTDAILTYKLNPSEDTSIEIGGLDKYEARCRTCWIR